MEGGIVTDKCSKIPMMSRLIDETTGEWLALEAPILSVKHDTPHQRMCERLMLNGWSSRQQAEAFLASLNIKP